MEPEKKSRDYTHVLREVTQRLKPLCLATGIVAGTTAGAIGLDYFITHGSTSEMTLPVLEDTTRKLGYKLISGITSELSVIATYGTANFMPSCRHLLSTLVIGKFLFDAFDTTQVEYFQNMNLLLAYSVAYGSMMTEFTLKKYPLTHKGTLENLL